MNKLVSQIPVGRHELFLRIAPHGNFNCFTVLYCAIRRDSLSLMAPYI